MGVFPPQTIKQPLSLSLPHARGGVSLGGDTFTHWMPSSPRPWGCFRIPYLRTDPLRVFPTPVGVFLELPLVEHGQGCLPHARGGVSPVSAISADLTSSSPRPWGCFLLFPYLHPYRSVFPTPVGVFLLFPYQFVYGVCLPHARGGVSSSLLDVRF